MSAATAQAQPDAKQNAVDTTCVYLNPDQTVAFYTGTETGTVTIEGCGTGEITLEFEGTLSPGGRAKPRPPGCSRVRAQAISRVCPGR
jgi:hypothetical protein